MKTFPCTSIRPPAQSVFAALLGLFILSSLMSACASSTAPPIASSPRATQTAAPPRLTYVAVGASDAFGVGTSDPDRDNWPTVLSHELGANVHLINLGIPGITVEGARKEELPIAVDAHPDIVTVWLAVNDLAASVPLDSYRQQLNTLLGSLKQHTHARIFVGNLPDLTLLPYFSGANVGILRSTVQAWNAVIARVAAANGATLVDLYGGWRELATHPEYLATDGLHPSTIGAIRLAGVFQSVIVASMQGARQP
jgi:lysophospholipase L1-like esterase